MRIASLCLMVSVFANGAFADSLRNASEQAYEDALDSFSVNDPILEETETFSFRCYRPTKDSPLDRTGFLCRALDVSPKMDFVPNRRIMIHFHQDFLLSIHLTAPAPCAIAETLGRIPLVLETNGVRTFGVADNRRFRVREGVCRVTYGPPTGLEKTDRMKIGPLTSEGLVFLSYLSPITKNWKTLRLQLPVIQDSD